MENLNRLLYILKNEFHINEKLLQEEYFDTPLTGNIFRFTAIELTYFFYLVEKEFNCHIDVDKILHYEFNTISGIRNLINKSQSQ